KRAEVADAIQFCVIAAINAIPSVDLSKGRLMTYLYRRLNGACQDFVRSCLPPGARRRSCYHNLRSTSSLYMLDRDDREYVDSLLDVEASEELAHVDARDTVRAFASRFNPNVQTLVECRFLHGMTLRECGDRIGVSESRASQMETELTERVRAMSARGELDFSSGQFRSKGVR